MADRAEFISKHVPYTINQMHGTHAELQGSHSQVIQNALIESFCISARALIDFTLGKNGEDARDYTNNYTPWAGAPLDSELKNKLSNQIAHLTLRRTEINTQKLDGIARANLYSAVLKEMDEVRQCLTSEFDQWPAELTKERKLGPAAQPSATNHVTSTSVQFGTTGPLGEV